MFCLIILHMWVKLVVYGCQTPRRIALTVETCTCFDRRHLHFRSATDNIAMRPCSRSRRQCTMYYCLKGTWTFRTLDYSYNHWTIRTMLRHWQKLTPVRWTFPTKMCLCICRCSDQSFCCVFICYWNFLLLRYIKSDCLYWTTIPDILNFQTF